MCFCLDQPQTWAVLIGAPLLILWFAAVNAALFYTARRSIMGLRRNTWRVIREPRTAGKPPRGHGEDEGNAGISPDWFGRIVVLGLLVFAAFLMVYLVVGQP